VSTAIGVLSPPLPTRVSADCDRAFCRSSYGLRRRLCQPSHRPGVTDSGRPQETEAPMLGTPVCPSRKSELRLSQIEASRSELPPARTRLPAFVCSPRYAMPGRAHRKWFSTQASPAADMKEGRPAVSAAALALPDTPTENILPNMLPRQRGRSFSRGADLGGRCVARTGLCRCGVLWGTGAVVHRKWRSARGALRLGCCSSFLR
jgi:hypothetical protein